MQEMAQGTVLKGLTGARPRARTEMASCAQKPRNRAWGGKGWGRSKGKQDKAGQGNGDWTVLKQHCGLIVGRPGSEGGRL